MRRNLLRSLSFSLLLAATAQAGAATPSAASSPADVVQGTTTELLTRIRSHQAEYRAEPMKFYRVVDELVLPHFDWAYISKLILARNWKDASQAQRDRFATAFQSMLIKTYADALLEYHDAAKIEWLGSETHPSKPLARVSSQLVRSDGPPIPVGFAMHQDAQQWKVYDISIDSVSLVNSFRGQFNAEIRSNGLDALIQRLEQTKIKSAKEVSSQIKG